MQFILLQRIGWEGSRLQSISHSLLCTESAKTVKSLPIYEKRINYEILVVPKAMKLIYLYVILYRGQNISFGHFDKLISSNFAYSVHLPPLPSPGTPLNVVFDQKM